MKNFRLIVFCVTLAVSTLSVISFLGGGSHVTAECKSREYCNIS